MDPIVDLIPSKFAWNFEYTYLKSLNLLDAYFDWKYKNGIRNKQLDSSFDTRGQDSRLTEI